MKKVFVSVLIFAVVVGVLCYFSQLNGSIRRVQTMLMGASDNIVTEQKRLNLAEIFGGNCNCQQWIDRSGNVSRSAFDASGSRIGTQVGHAGGPNGIVVEMTYLEPDADHPLGQAFDGAGHPTPLHTGPGQGNETPGDRTQRASFVSTVVEKKFLAFLRNSGNADIAQEQVAVASERNANPGV
jgi:hypothetical protein